MRPKSIIRFEQLFLGALALNLINIIQNWDFWELMTRESGEGMTYFLLIAPFIINLWLWYKIARKPSTVAKWVMVALFIVHVIWSLATTDNYRALGLTLVFAIVVLKGAAIYMLFKSDAKPWFARKALET